MKPSVTEPNNSLLLRLLVFALVYWAGAEMVYATPGDFADFWLPGGIYLAVLLRTPPRRWGAVALAAGAANFLADVVVHGQPWRLGAGYVLLNVGLPLAGAALLVRWCRPAFSLARLPHVLLWGLVVSFLNALLSALGGAALKAVISGNDFGQKWQVWWIGSLLGMLVALPLTIGILDWLDGRSGRKSAVGAREGVVLLLSAGLASWLFFRLPDLWVIPPAVLFLFLMWAALRLNATWVAATALLMLVIGLGLTAAGSGPYSLLPAMQSRMLTVQLLIAVGAFLFYILAAVMAERRAATEALHVLNADLDQKVQARTNEIETLYQSAPVGLAYVDRDLRFVRINDELAAMNGKPAAAHLGKTIHEIVPDLAPKVEADFRRILATGEPVLNVELIGETSGDPGVPHTRLESWFPHKDASGQVIGLSGVAQDITERKRQEEQLRRNHETFFRLVKNTPFGIYIVDADFRLIEISQGAQKVFSGIKPLIGRDFAEILHIIWGEPFATDVIEIFRHTLRTGEPYQAANTTEQRHNIEDVESYDWKIERITLPDGRFGIVCYFYDLTVQKQIQEELRQSEERFRLASEAATTLVYDADLTGSRQTITHGLERVTGYTSAEVELTSDWYHSLIHSEDLPTHLDNLARQLRAGKTYRATYRLRRKDGAWIWVEDIGQIIRDENGQAVQLVGALVDITARKEAENERAHLAAIVASSNDAIISKSLDGVITSWNQGAEKLFGYTAQEAVGQPITLLIPPERLDEEPQILDNIRRGNVVNHYETVRQRKDGTQFDISLTVSPVRAASGAIIGASKIARDISERKRREAHLAFLADLQGVLLPRLSTAEIMQMAGERIAAYFGLTHCLFVEIDEAALTATVVHDQHAAGVNDLTGVYQIAEFHTAAERQTLGRGATLAINNVRDDVREPEAVAAFEALGIRALINAPYISERGWQFALSAMHAQPYAWRDDDGELLQELAARIYIRIERARAEEALRESEERMRLVLNAAQVGIWILDVVAQRIYWSPDNYQIFGVAEFDGHVETFRRMVHPDDLAALWQQFAQALETGEPYQSEFRIVRPDGAVRWVGNLGHAEFDAQGKPRRVLGTAIDITERKQAEDVLRASEEFNRTVLESSPDCIKVLDLEGRLLMMNTPGMCLMEIDDFAPFCGRAWWELWPEESHADIRQAFAIARTGGTGRLRAFCSTAKGTLKYWDVVVTPVRDGQGEIARLVSTSRDITEEQKLEAERERLLQKEQHARQLAEDATRAKDEFVALVSHELRNPLNTIMGYNRMLQAGPADDADRRKYTEIIENSARRQLTLLEDLLDTARLVSGKLKLSVRPFNLAHVITETVEAARPSAEAKHISLALDLPSAAETDLTGDPDRLQQVVWNLLTNAVKFTPAHGAVLVSLLPQPGALRLIVADTGKGIAAEMLPYVFDRFRQADSSSTRRHGGLGLGLALVKQLVEMHGGTIEANSAGAGLGATFTVTLPLRAVPQPIEAAPVAVAVALETSATLAGCQVLVVDDEAEAREIVTTLLTSNGAQVTAAESAATALALLGNAARPAFDVMVSDIGMPDMDGYELLRQARAQGCKIPAVAVTAYSRSEDRLRALHAGFQMHVPKPVEPSELIAVITSLVNRRNPA